MGLDITAYRGITVAEGNEAFDDTGELKYNDGWFILRINSSFPGRADDIKDRHAYKSEGQIHFRAGPYSSYNRWRDDLAKLAGWALSSYEEYGRDWPSYAASAWQADGGPFWELIHFSDCEGTIGAAVSAKLAKDFGDYQEKANEQNEMFRAAYGNWRRVFEFASQRGAVMFS